jgi:hypothetical protein
MAENTWSTREGLILEAMFEVSESGGDIAQAAKSAVPDLRSEVYMETIAALASDDYIDATVMRDGMHRATSMPMALKPKGRRSIGQWPSENVADELDRVLARLAEAETDPVQKGKFQRLRAALADAGKDVAARTIAELAKSLGGHL